jgi:hypothetical protein
VTTEKSPAPDERVLATLTGVKPTAGGWTALCPAHEDHHPSLAIREGPDGQVLLHCFAGCKVEAVAAATGLEMADLFPTRKATGKQVREVAAKYDYRDAEGKLLYQVVRFVPKTFRQRRPGPNGTWIWNLDGVKRVPYRLPELQAADPLAPVYIVEGEKDVDRLLQAGLVATTNSGGAGKWREDYSNILRDRHVVVIPDNDDPGRRHAQQVAKSLFGVARSVKVVHL